LSFIDFFLTFRSAAELSKEERQERG